MKILIITQYFYPENFRINDITKELIKRGHNVTVLTGLPNYPNGDIYDGYKDAYNNVENFFGAKVYRCKIRPRKKGTLNLLFNYISFVKQAKIKLKRIKPIFDIIYFYEPSPITSGIPAIWYGKKYNIKTVIYNMDIWPDCVRDSRGGKVLSKCNPIYGISKIVSKYVYKRFDLIINKCDEFGQYLSEELAISNKKMVTLFEHAEDNYLSVNETPVDNGILDFMFLGNIGKAQNCDQILYAFSKLNIDKIALHFVGEGSYIKKIKELANTLCIKNKVYFYGKKSVEEVISLYNLADVCLLTLSNRTASGLTPPGKLFSYMAASRPILASINGAAQGIIKNAKCGFVCDADDTNGLYEMFLSVINQKDNLTKMGKNARLYFLNNFTLEKHIKQLEIIFNRVSEE